MRDRPFKPLKKKNENGRFLILEAMIDDCVVILINLYNPNTEKEQVSTWEKLNLMLQTFDDLENKIIILGGDFNLFLDSALEAAYSAFCFFRYILAYSIIFSVIKAYTHTELLLRKSQAYSGIFSTLCNSGIFTTLPYSEPWNI